MAGFKIKTALIAAAIFSYNFAAPDIAQAKSKKHNKFVKADIRPVENSSVDLFEVLSHIPQAQKAFDVGDYALALQHYRYVYLHDPKQSQAAIGYGDSALALGQNQMAASIYAAFKADNPQAQSGWILSQIMLKKTDNTENKLREQLEITSDDARLWNMLGRILDTDNRHDEARQAYAMAELSGQRAGLAANNIGQSFLQQGDVNAALSEFTRASLAAPQNRLFDNNRRLSLLLQKDYALALDHLEKNRAAQLLKDAGVIVAAQGETKLAVYFLEKSIALNPVHDQAAQQYLAELRQ